jgi:hypothetical protein
MNIAILEDQEDLKNKISSDLNDYRLEYKSVDLGGGADWWFIVITILSTFFLGKKINENLDAWKEIGLKFKKILEKEKMPLFIDIDVAKAIAIADLNEKTQIKSLELMKSDQIIDRNFDHKGFKLDFTPYNYYILVFKVNRLENFIYCIKSNGKIQFKDYFENSEWNFPYDWSSYSDREDYTT